MPLRVLIVDDSAGFRALARRLLTRRGFEIAGEAEDAAEAFELARSLSPDAVLLDMNLPDGDGVSVARELLGLPAPPRILLTSGDSNSAGRAIAADDAAAFVSKENLPLVNLEELLCGGAKQ